MTVDEFLARFPEVPRDLGGEPVLREYVGAFGAQLRVAQKPTPCIGKGGDAEHVFYTRLVNDLAIYGVGLAKRDRTLARLEKLLDEGTGSSPPPSRAHWCPRERRAHRARAAARPSLRLAPHTEGGPTAHRAARPSGGSTRAGSTWAKSTTGSYTGSRAHAGTGSKGRS